MVKCSSLKITTKHTNTKHMLYCCKSFFHTQAKLKLYENPIYFLEIFNIILSSLHQCCTNKVSTSLIIQCMWLALSIWKMIVNFHIENSIYRLFRLCSIYIIKNDNFTLWHINELWKRCNYPCREAKKHYFVPLSILLYQDASTIYTYQV